MMPSPPDDLDRQLRDLTNWTGDQTRVWEQASSVARTSPTPPSIWNAGSIFVKPLGRPWLFGLVATIAVIGVASVLLPSLGNTRSAARVNVPSMSTMAREAGPGTAPAVSMTPEASRQKASERLERLPGTDPAARYVVQKATIELVTHDVRAVFAKANHLVSTASGEFVENSSLTGGGNTAEANLTLRVTAARLSEVLNQLRALGEVKSENTTGEDVTSQVVDLEARIRNEQRVEKELLELLEKRTDAPLKDILELRASLATVRQATEQYIAQRDHVGHMVSLASVLVVIRPETEFGTPPTDESIVTYFRSSVGEAWHVGLRSASDSASWLLGVVVSGAVWWLILGIVAYAIHRYRRRLAARCV